MMTALGFIETFGLLPAIEAADAMLKAADVRLVEKTLVSGGLVTVSVTGEVAAVQAAVDAGAAAVGRIQGARLVSRHVIARPDDELARIIDVDKLSHPADAAEPAQARVNRAGPAPAEDRAKAAPVEPDRKTAPAETAPAEADKTEAPAVTTGARKNAGKKSGPNKKKK